MGKFVIRCMEVNNGQDDGQLGQWSDSAPSCISGRLAFVSCADNTHFVSNFLW